MRIWPKRRRWGTISVIHRLDTRVLRAGMPDVGGTICVQDWILTHLSDPNIYLALQIRLTIGRSKIAHWETYDRATIGIDKSNAFCTFLIARLNFSTKHAIHPLSCVVCSNEELASDDAYNSGTYHMLDIFLIVFWRFFSIAALISILKVCVLDIFWISSLFGSHWTEKVLKPSWAILRRRYRRAHAPTSCSSLQMTKTFIWTL